VGASLLAKALDQCHVYWLARRLREQTRSHRRQEQVVQRLLGITGALHLAFSGLLRGSQSLIHRGLADQRR
jgi:hypothetical protein